MVSVTMVCGVLLSVDEEDTSSTADRQSLVSQLVQCARHCIVLSVRLSQRLSLLQWPNTSGSCKICSHVTIWCEPAVDLANFKVCLFACNEKTNSELL